MLRRPLPLVLLLLLLTLTIVGARVYYQHAYAGEVDDIRFESADGTTLAGSLILPATDGPHPAIVLVHGAGPDTRGMPGYRAHIQPLVRAGYAVLTYDKRGAGESGGDFDTMTYGDLVSDATAAVALLRSRDDIDAGRVALAGFSEGGWLVPEVAERSGGVTFILVKSGAPLSWAETVAWEVENDTRADGFEGDRLTTLVELRKRLWRYYIATATFGPDSTRAEREQIEAEIGKLESWTPDGAPISIQPYDHDVYRRWAADVAYDPTPFILRNTAPMLYLFGGADVNIPVEVSTRRIEELRAQGLTHITYHVYPEDGHGLQHWTRFWNAGYPDGYFERIIDWAREAGR